VTASFRYFACSSDQRGQNHPTLLFHLIVPNGDPMMNLAILEDLPKHHVIIRHSGSDDLATTMASPMSADQSRAVLLLHHRLRMTVAARPPFHPTISISSGLGYRRYALEYLPAPRTLRPACRTQLAAELKQRDASWIITRRVDHNSVTAFAVSREVSHLCDCGISRTWRCSNSMRSGEMIRVGLKAIRSRKALEFRVVSRTMRGKRLESRERRATWTISRTGADVVLRPKMLTHARRWCSWRLHVS